MDCVVETLRHKFAMMRPFLDERGRRLWAGVEASAIGRGGISRVAEATGLSRATVRQGVKDVASGVAAPGDGSPPSGRTRKPGGGRKRLTENDPELLSSLERQLEPATSGGQDSPLRWTCNSAASIAARMRAEGRMVSERTVNRLLHELGYSLQANRKTIEGRQHPDRNGQFRRINRRVRAFQKLGLPVVSVATRKKELADQFSNCGNDWHPKGRPVALHAHDFQDPDPDKVLPWRAGGMTANRGWACVGISSNTTEFAVEAVRRWWKRMGSPLYPDARRLLITAGGGGSNGSRNRLWKLEIQRLADEFGLAISVSHLPPGTSKWNRVEHSMFCHTSQNWRGMPLVSHEVIVNLIAATTTNAGLSAPSGIEESECATGSDDRMEAFSIRRSGFSGEWNYTLFPCR
ncbi:MAG: ISAzo13 family transposase [Boseongicola sp.]|nr:ISAzo13 family transposase [Boseongicola sp.]